MTTFMSLMYVYMHVCVLHVGGKGYPGLQRTDFFGGLQESAL